jgi:hypothetical protein
MKNLQDSANFLLNSIDNSIMEQLNPFLLPTTTGPEIWMRIIGEIQSFSTDRLLTVVDQIKKTKLKDFKGEDVKKYVSTMMNYCRDVDHGESLPCEICITIVDQLIDCSVEKFRMEFLSYRPTVMNELRLYRGKSPEVIRSMQKYNRYFTFESLLKRANLAYQSLVDQSLWGPDVHSRDRTSTPESLTAEANALVQKAIAKFKKDFTKEQGKTSDDKQSD